MQSSNDPYNGRRQYRRSSQSQSSSSTDQYHDGSGESTSTAQSGSQWSSVHSPGHSGPYPPSGNYADLHSPPFSPSSALPVVPSQGYAGYPPSAQVYPPGLPSIDPSVPSHYQNYRPMQHGHPVVPSQYFDSQQHTASSHTAQGQYGASPTQVANAYGQYSTSPGSHSYQQPHASSSHSASHPSSSTVPPTSPSLSSNSSSPYACDLCGSTFTRPHDRKRHFESHHTTIQHVCRFCGKGYARVDSLKRHYDKPCDKMPPRGSAP